MRLQWVKCGSDWCGLLNVNLSEVATSGVYIIWYSTNPSRVVYVGQGKIADRIEAHRRDPSVTQYSSRGTLLVTWASVPVWQRDGVERYLADRYSPLEGELHPAVVPIAVNSPWGG